MLCTVVLLRKMVYVNTLSVSVTVHTAARNEEHGDEGKLK